MHSDLLDVDLEMANADDCERVLSARSIKSPSGEMEVLSPEGSIYMTEMRVNGSSPFSGKITTNSSTKLIGVPRKTNDVDNVNETSARDLAIKPSSPSTVLKNAGVDIDLNTLTSNGDSASLELLSQFMNCLMREKYEAAKLLCEKVLEFEPSNDTVKEFLPVIMERLKLDTELSSEESSDSDSESNTSSDSDSSATTNSTSEEDTYSLSSHRNCTHHHS